MNSLKAKMALALAGDPIEGAWCFDPTDEEYDDPHAQNMRMDFLRQADAAIAAFEAALLQPEVVTALLEAVEDDSILAMALSANKQAGRPIANEASIEMGRKWVQAALAAMTGTETRASVRLDGQPQEDDDE